MVNWFQVWCSILDMNKMLKDVELSPLLTHGERGE